ERLLRVEPASDTNQRLSELRVDAPIAPFVGIGQGRPAHIAAQSQVIKLRWLGAKTCFDIPQTLPVRQLRKGHAQKLIETREGPDVEIPAVLADEATKRVPWGELHDLREHELASVHWCLPGLPGQAEGLSAHISNR